MAKSAARAEIVEKRSRFIGSVSPVTGEDEALDFIKRVKTEFYDARHNVFAYVIRDGAERFSDDGEPQGTGGLPALEVLRKRSLVNTAVVVTRYFGGILLGAPGLVRAYTRAAADAAQNAGTVTMRLCDTLTLRCGYDFYARAEKFLHACDGIVSGRDFGQQVELSLIMPKESTAGFERQITELSAGTVRIAHSGETYIGSDAFKSFI